MRRCVALVLSLCLALPFAGCCEDQGPDVQPGSENHAEHWVKKDGTEIHAWGNVVNVGDEAATNVTMTFFFLASGVQFYSESRPLGAIGAGERVDFDEWFKAPATAESETLSYFYTTTWDN